MQLKHLFSCDNSFKLSFPEQWDGDLLGVSTPSFFQDKTIVFAKNQKFYKKIMERRKEIPSTVGIIFEEKFWLQLEEKSELEDIFAFIGTCSDLTLLMTSVSKIYYDEKVLPLNFFEDARSMGKVSIGENCKVAETSFIGRNVTIGCNTRIHPGVVIMPSVSIGDNCEIFPNVTIYNFTQIGNNCRIHAGTTIGSDGFGYNFYNGRHLKLWHSGGVIIEDDVEIGANSCVDMGTFTPTIIHSGVKLDNQVQIAHNVELGQGVILCGQSGIAGSVSVGPYTVFGGQTGVTHDISVGSQCQVGGFSAVTSSLADGSKVAGTPARPFGEWLAGLAYVRKQSLKKK